MSAYEPDSVTTETSETQRAWLASILLRSQQTWFGPFTLQLQRLVTLGRGQRRRLERKAAVSLAGAALVLSLGANDAARDGPRRQHHRRRRRRGQGRRRQCSIDRGHHQRQQQQRAFCHAGECEAGPGRDTINLPGNGLFTLTSAYSN